jgi:hypothetical protein
MFKERCYIFCGAAFYFGFLLILNKFLLMEVYIKLKKQNLRNVNRFVSKIT